MAIDDNIIPHDNQLIKNYFDSIYPDIDWSDGKDSISIYHLLTMSSGIDAIDFGLNRESFANESNYQNATDWTHHILQAPMVKRVGQEGNYGSGSPHILGAILDLLLPYPTEFYIHRRLFDPLSIVNYRIQVTNINTPYFGGGWYLSSQDLLKYAQLILNQGNKNSKSILSPSWVQKSTAKHTTLENTFDKNKYGYLFWHKTYTINGHQINSIESRGTGGQYVFIVPALELTAVITSGNYGNNKGFQPERIFRDYILKNLLGE